MQSTTTFITAGAVALGLLAGPSVAAFRQDATLRYKWTKGDTVRYQIVQQSTSVLSGLPGMGDMNIDQTSTQVLLTTAENVAADGTATLKQTVESVKMQMNSPMFSFAFDSVKPEAATDPMSSMLKNVLSPMIGASFTVVMASTGEIRSVDGLSQVAEKMFKNVGQDPAMAGMFDGLKANVSDDAMRSMLSQAYTQFPARPIKPGDTWNAQVSSGNPMLGTVVTSIASTLKSMNGDGTATIAQNLTVKQDPSKPPQPNPMGMSMKMGEATGTGEQTYEVASGRLRRAQTNVTMPVSMSGTGPDGSALNMSMSVRSTTTIDLVAK
jgi:hypothetical protein